MTEFKRIYLIPSYEADDSFIAFYLPEEDFYFPENYLIPQLKKHGLLPKELITMSDFSWFVIVAAVISAVAAYLSSRAMSKALKNGYQNLTQYLVNGKYLYCKDDCGHVWRLNYNKSGHIDIQERSLEGQNIRFDCALLPNDFLALIPCPATKTRAEQMLSGQSSNLPTVDTGTSAYVKYALLGLLGIVVFYFAYKQFSG